MQSARGPEARAVSPAGDAKARAHATRDHVWHMETLAPARPRRIRAADGDAVSASSTSTDRRAESGGDRMVGGADRTRRRRHGRQAAATSSRRGTRGPGPAGGEVPRPRVPADHLRAGVRPAARTSSGCGSAGFRASGRWRCASSRSGSKALERFVRSEPLRRVHECVFGVLALESEPVDPRL